MKRLKLPNPNKWVIWISIALTVKILFLFLRTIEFPVENHHYCYTFGQEGGDTISYIEPIENLLSTGEYFDDYRMPGYGWLYFIVRLFASQTFSLNLLIILQVLLSAISVYVLSLISLMVFKQVTYFYWTYLIYLFSIYVSIYDLSLLTESFCTSCIIFSTYFLLKGGNINHFLSGLFVTWAIFLRPVFAPLLLIFLIYLLFDYYRKYNLKLHQNLIYTLFWLYFPFMLIEGSWVYRNYERYNRIIPLTKSTFYTSTEESFLVTLYGFMNAFGGSLVFWEPSNEITFFIHDAKKKPVFPEYIYTSQFNLDSLNAVKNKIKFINSDTISSALKQQIELDVIRKLNNYTNSIKEEKPYLYYIQSRLISFKRFLFHSGTTNLFHNPYFKLNIFQLIAKFFYSLLYVLVAFGGLVGLIILFFKGLKTPTLFLISSMGLYSSMIFPFILKMDEYRYFVPAYPIFTLATTFLLITIYRKFKKTT